jgi:uncharacterized protein
MRTRREFIGLGAGGAVTVAFGGAFWSEIFAAAEEGRLKRVRGYGARKRPDENGIRLPEGFRSRLVARGGRRVPGTDYVWHRASDGAATFPSRDGGWILVSNSETRKGGASAIRFQRDGRIADAYRILGGTTQNCSGGATPWGTWLSCEEVEGGHVWECDPTGSRKAVSRPALGAFKHEAAAVDPRGRRIYLTEDRGNGGLYRFTPTRWRDLSSGLLEIATVHPGGRVTWSQVPDPAAERVPTREQVPGSTRFRRAEGIRLDGRVLYIATTADHRVHAYDLRRGRIRVVYDGLASRSAPVLRPDQIGVSPGGEVFVCEDLATREIDLGLLEPAGRMSRFLSVTGRQHVDSELTGIAFDPRGQRMYLASQRALGGAGAVYEVRGPFRRRRA